MQHDSWRANARTISLGRKPSSLAIQCYERRVENGLASVRLVCTMDKDERALGFLKALLRNCRAITPYKHRGGTLARVIARPKQQASNITYHQQRRFQ